MKLTMFHQSKGKLALVQCWQFVHKLRVNSFNQRSKPGSGGAPHNITVIKQW